MHYFGARSWDFIMWDGGAVRAGCTGDGERRHIMPRSVTVQACCGATSRHGGLARHLLRLGHGYQSEVMMRYYKTRQGAFRYGRRMCQPTGRGFTVAQVETGRWAGYWFALPA